MITIHKIPGYQVGEQLYNGSRTLVYRGYTEIDSLAVVIKLLKNLYPSFNELVQFRNQYTIAKNINSPKIIQTYSLEVLACDRLKNISTSLRILSRADKDYKVPFNIHDGINSTILILKHRLKANELRPDIEVITEYGNLPSINCFPGQLNQVFMNILANAIDALEESNIDRTLNEIQVHPHRITIKTSTENQFIKITIADNGSGMTQEVQQHIFDHLFTTKAVGKGTGLGLAIARQIIEETHGGKLSFHSVLGLGTKFFIEIPLA